MHIQTKRWRKLDVSLDGVETEGCRNQTLFGVLLEHDLKSDQTSVERLLKS